MNSVKSVTSVGSAFAALPNEREAAAIADAVDAMCAIGILELINPNDPAERHRYRVMSRIGRRVEWEPNEKPKRIEVPNLLTGKVVMTMADDPFRVIGRRIRRVEDEPFGLMFPGLFPAL